ncbi:MAG TPA: peptidoglycan-binding protein [Stellaceae bacterium]|jgi:peptidoglycan hydrolase-like protein with peptidoglycan-binding domain|nr:peptidoglycan-binding protein [Stellaceae bacterium]
MKLQTLRGIGIALVLMSGGARPDAAAAANSDPLKGDIDAFFQRVEIATAGRLHWSGADSIDVHDEGGEAIARISNGHFALRRPGGDAKPVATITLDRIDIRRHPATTGSDMAELVVSLPTTSTMTTDDGNELTLSLKEAKATALFEGAAERQREATLDVAGGQFDEKSHTVRVSFGPVSAHWKTIRGDDGSWRAPGDFAVDKLAFLIPEASLAGEIDRIAYQAEAAGPDLSALDALRDKTEELRENFRDEPQKRLQATAALVPQMLELFSSSKGMVTVERLNAKRPDGETLVSLAKAWFGGEGRRDGDNAAFRLTLGHDGLALALSILSENQVPNSVELDFGVEDIALAAIRNLATAAQAAAAASPDDRQKYLPQIIAAAMSLKPVFHLYDALANFKDVGIAASGKAERAPPLPIGYAAAGDVIVSGFDALGQILTAGIARGHLALLKFLGEPGSYAAGDKIMQFHLASQLGKPITVNGNDLGEWFGGKAPAGQPRRLRLTDPPVTGDDVRAVQKLVMADGPTDGVYDVVTALAVMRFQKAHGLNVNGVVDAPTREKLGLAPPPPPAKN